MQPGKSRSGTYQDEGPRAFLAAVLTPKTAMNLCAWLALAGWFFLCPDLLARAARGGVSDAGTQMVTNVMTGQPVMEGVEDAALTGAITGGVGGAMQKSCFLAGTEVMLGDGQRIAIEEIRLGQRVWTPDGQAGSTCVNAETWKRYDVRLLDEESGRDAFDISVLVPPGWLEQRSRKDGQEVWLEFDELDAAGWAQVVRESACPPIAEGPGRVVTATITHASEDVRSLTLSRR